MPASLPRRARSSSPSSASTTPSRALAPSGSIPVSSVPPAGLDWDVLTDRAKRLHRFLKQEQIDLPLHRCQTITARQHRFASWHDAQVRLDPATLNGDRRATPPDTVPEFPPNEQALAAFRALRPLATARDDGLIANDVLDPALAHLGWAPRSTLVVGDPGQRAVLDRALTVSVWSWLLHHEPQAPRLTLMAGNERWKGLLNRWRAHRHDGWEAPDSEVSGGGHARPVNPFMLPLGRSRPSIGHAHSLGLMVLHALGRLPMERHQRPEGVHDAVAFVNALYAAYEVQPMRAVPGQKAWSGLVALLVNQGQDAWSDPHAWDQRLGSAWRGQPWAAVRDIAVQRGEHQLARIAHAQAMPCWADLLVAVDHEGQSDTDLDGHMVWRYDATQGWGRRSPLDPRAFFDDWRTTDLNDWPEALDRLTRTGLGNAPDVELGAFLNDADHDSTPRTAVLHAWAWMNDRIRARLERPDALNLQDHPEGWAIDLDLQVRAGPRRVRAMTTPLIAALMEEIAGQERRRGVSVWRLGTDPMRQSGQAIAGSDRRLTAGSTDHDPVGTAWTCRPTQAVPDAPDASPDGWRAWARTARTPLDAGDARWVQPADRWMCPTHEADRRWASTLSQALQHEDVLTTLARAFPSGSQAEASWWNDLVRRPEDDPRESIDASDWDRERSLAEDQAWAGLWQALLAANPSWRGISVLLQRDRHGWTSSWRHRDLDG